MNYHKESKNLTEGDWGPQQGRLEGERGRLECAKATYVITCLSIFSKACKSWLDPLPIKQKGYSQKVTYSIT